MMAGALEISVTPGGLQSRLAEIQNTRDNSVVLKGTADVRDLALIKQLPANVKSLDMKNLTTEAYNYKSGNYMGGTTFNANELVPYMLFGTKIESIVFPAGMTSIAEASLAHSALKNVTIPAKVTKVGAWALADSYSLTKVEFSASNNLDKGVFRACRALADVKINGTLSTVPDGTFERCTSLDAGLPAGAVHIGASAYRGSGMTSLDLDGVETVGAYAFAEIPTLSEITLSTESQPVFGTGAFFGDDALEAVPSWTVSLPQLFGASSSTNIETIDSEVIGEGAFANDPSITTMKFGANVKQVKANAFRNDTNLKWINMHDLGNNTPEVDATAFSGLEDANGRYPADLYVDEDKVDTWKNHPVWGLFNIKTGSTNTIETPEDFNIDILREGNQVVVNSNAAIDSMEIYTVSGLKLYEGGSNDSTLRVDMPAGEVIVVKVVSGGKLKVAKLR